MPASAVVEVADAVVTALNAATLSQSFTATRLYILVDELKNFTSLRVSVIPQAMEVTNISRDESQEIYRIDIAIQKKLTDADDKDEVDTMMLLVEEVCDLLIRTRPSGHPAAIARNFENDPIYSDEHLRELRQFTSVVTFIFREAR